MNKPAIIIIVAIFATWSTLSTEAKSQQFEVDDMVATDERLQRRDRSARRRVNSYFPRRRVALEAEVADKVKEATMELRQQIRDLQRQIVILDSTTEKIQQEQDEDRAENECIDGFTYQNKCYFTVLRSSSGVFHDEARIMCTSRGAKLADIQSLEHENMVQDLMRKSLQERYIQVWLGMTKTDGNIYLTNGTIVPSTNYSWYDETFPHVEIGSNILIQATDNRRFQGMLNRSPTFHNSRGALCMM